MGARGISFQGNYPYCLTRAAACLEQWANGLWPLNPPLKVNWPDAQSIFHFMKFGSLSFFPRSLPVFGPAVGPGPNTDGLDMVQNLDPVPPTCALCFPSKESISNQLKSVRYLCKLQ